MGNDAAQGGQGRPSADGTDVAMVFANIGPYHVARFSAAAARLARSGRSLGVVEVASQAGRSGYQWQPMTAPVDYRHQIVSTSRDYDDLSCDEIDRGIRAALDEMHPSVVVVNGWSAAEARAALDWCLERRVPRVLLSTSQQHDYARSTAKEWVKSRLVRNFQAALVGGRSHADYLVRLGMDRTRIFEGFNVVDNDYFAGAAARTRAAEQEARARLGLPARYLLFVGRFIPEKNIPVLLEAYASYVRDCDGEPCRLVLLGAGPLEEALREQAARLQLQGRVSFHPYAQYDVLPQYYACAHGLVLPSVKETWGLVVNEAMACGLPVLVSNRCGCSGHLVEEDGNGQVLDPGDVAGMAARLSAIDRLSAADWSRMGARSRALIEDWGTGRFAEALLRATVAAAASSRRQDGRYRADEWLVHRLLRWLPA